MNKYKAVKLIDRRAKRLGRGYGSGKGGHTSGRGQKGQKSRGKIGIIFEGVKVKKSLIKKIPLARGKDKFNTYRKPITIRLDLLNVFSVGEVVDLKALVSKDIINGNEAKRNGVKVVLGSGFDKKLKINLPISASAMSLVEKLGGEIVKV